VKAETQAAGGRGQQFAYDGFGNLVSKSGTPEPVTNVVVDRGDKPGGGVCVNDANGNHLWTNTQTLRYDYENRATWVDDRNNTGKRYGYDPNNQRVYETGWANGVEYSQEAVHFLGVTSQRMGSYRLGVDEAAVVLTP
jgi:hypothetical protein